MRRGLLSGATQPEKPSVAVIPSFPAGILSKTPPDIKGIDQIPSGMMRVWLQSIEKPTENSLRSLLLRERIHGYRDSHCCSWARHALDARHQSAISIDS
jgi:hypothetical protein